MTARRRLEDAMIIAASMLAVGLTAGLAFGSWQVVLFSQAVWVAAYWIGCRVIDWYVARKA
jgi:hypothetical protein